MWGAASSNTAEIYMQFHEHTAISAALHSPNVWERFVDDVYSIKGHLCYKTIFYFKVAFDV